ncbi:MAG: hypothetical protein JO076_11690 [Verrucomicrobia bacterium]|nr:hypothetical protein [Verrucomicrobiota bacterium]
MTTTLRYWTNSARWNRSGFCIGGCFLALLVLFLILGAIVWGGISTYQGAYQMTSREPRHFEPIPSTAAQNAAKLKWGALEAALQRGDAVNFQFSAEDLNAWFFSDGQNSDLVAHLRFGTTADWLVAYLSVPLDFMAEIPGLPSFKHRFFNGRLALRLAIQNGELKIKGIDLEGNGHRLPWLFTGQGYRDTFQQTFEQGFRTRFPGGELLISRLESIQIENGKISVRFREAS